MGTRYSEVKSSYDRNLIHRNKDKSARWLLSLRADRHHVFVCNGNPARLGQLEFRKRSARVEDRGYFSAGEEGKNQSAASS